MDVLCVIPYATGIVALVRDEAGVVAFREVTVKQLYGCVNRIARRYRDLLRRLEEADTMAVGTDKTAEVNPWLDRRGLNLFLAEQDKIDGQRAAAVRAARRRTGFVPPKGNGDWLAPGGATVVLEAMPHKQRRTWYDPTIMRPLIKGVKAPVSCPKALEGY